MSVLDGPTSAKRAVGGLLMALAKMQMRKAILGLADVVCGGGFFD